jgi:hypothetical protein
VIFDLLVAHPAHLHVVTWHSSEATVYSLGIMLCAALLLVAAAASSAQRTSGGPSTIYDDGLIGPQLHIDQVCRPSNSTGYNLDAPCNQMDVITTECIHGADGLALYTGHGDAGALGEAVNNPDFEGDEDSVAVLSNNTQRDCICQSNYYQAIQGCYDCYDKHGFGDAVALDMPIISSVSSSYCAVSNTPTGGFIDILNTVEALVESSVMAQGTSDTSTTATYSDPLGNNTAVPKYFTPSATGNGGWSVAEATQTPSNRTMTGPTTASSSTSLSVSNGQIVPTVDGVSSKTSGSASGTASGALAPASASTTAGSGVGRQEVAAMACVAALFGLVTLM